MSTLPGQSSHGIQGQARYEFAEQIAELKRQIKTLQTANSSQATTITEGSLTVDDADGNPVVILGDTGIALVGNPIGMIALRPDGSVAFSLNPFVAIWDKSGNYIVTDDATSGQGLARPYLSLGAWVDVADPAATVTSSNWTTVQQISFYKQHPKVLVEFKLRSDAADTSGDIRVIDGSGVQLGNAGSVSGAVTVQGFIGASALSGGHLSFTTLSLQVRRTGGNGHIGARGITAYGVESAVGEI